MIKTYGLFWKPENVFWGRPKAPGGLLGKKHGNSKNSLVDFREQIGVYVLYQQFQVVYVGMAEQTPMLPRIRSHLSDLLQDRWDRFSWFGLLEPLEEPDTPVHFSEERARSLASSPSSLSLTPREIIQHLEGRAIVAFETPLNRQGPSFGGAERYVQVRHPALGPKTEEIIANRASEDADGLPCFRGC